MTPNDDPRRTSAGGSDDLHAHDSESDPEGPFPWEAEDVRAGLDAPPPPPIEDLAQQTERMAGEVAAFLDSGEAPSADDDGLYLVFPAENRLMILSAGENSSLLCGFSTPGRAMYWLAGTRQGTPEMGIAGVSLSGMATLGLHERPGLVFGLDPCPFSDRINMFPGEHLGDARRLQAFVTAERAVLRFHYDYYVDMARRELLMGNAERARQLAQHVVTFVDAESPEVHLVLAQAGAALKDAPLVARKQRLVRALWPEMAEQLPR